ncbi:hypothetical protein OQA88_8891 [Cercophora sp. LCS_1]
MDLVLGGPVSDRVLLSSCLRCRGRRSFCSKDRPVCSRCREGGYDCIYEEGRRVAINESYFRELQAKAKKYDGTTLDPNGRYARVMADETELRGRVRNAANAGPARTETIVERAENSDEEFEEDYDILGPFTRISIDKPMQYNKGPGSADYFLRNVSQLSHVPGDDEVLYFSPTIYDPDALISRRLLVWSQVRLPPLDVARRLFAAQYTYLGTIFAFTDPTSFEREFLEACRGPPDLSDKDACLAYAKVLVILAFGKLYSINQWIDYQGPPGFEYFSQAVQLLPDAHEQGSMLCVETLALTGYFLQNMNRPDAAFIYIGMALHMAISLGLHQEVTSPLPPAAREHRRRVWWSIYSLDRIITLKSGNPITIHDEDIGVNLPSKLPGESDYCPAVVLQHYTELSRILGLITKCIYRKATTPKSARKLMAAVTKITTALTKWDRELPEEIRFNPAKLNTSRESVSTFSHYYQCINMTARPLLFHVVKKRLEAIRLDPAVREKDWKEGLSATTIQVIEMCISAAEETIRMMAEARARDLLATYGYMDGEHVFSAAIVLVMVCAAFPEKETSKKAMDVGLDLLRGMAQRGSNGHMGARYQLLAKLRGVFMPGKGPEPLDIPVSPVPVSPGLGMQGQPWEMASPGEFGRAILAAQVGFREGFGEGGTPPMGAGGVGLGVAGDLGVNVMGEGLAAEGLAAEGTPLELLDDMEGLAQEDAGNMGVDFTLWEEGFANPMADAADLSHWGWTQS